jgi:hypothetical protein
MRFAGVTDARCDGIWHNDNTAHPTERPPEGGIAPMHSSKRLRKQPRVHRLDHINRCALSDCCGAPIIQGGICFDCREHCEEENGVPRSTRFHRTPVTPEESFALAYGERPSVAFLDDDSTEVFDGLSVSGVFE